MNEIDSVHPICVPTEATASFIESVVPSPASILEVGCGNGQVAVALKKRGYAVVAVESDETAVLAVRKLGIDVIAGSWPDVDVEPVSAVVFTRSLHHISPLPEAVEKIRDILLPQGAVLVEDFAYTEASSQAINWLLKTAVSERGRALIAHNPDSLITKLLNSDDPASVWHQDHDHDLHTFEEMTNAMGKVFDIREALRVPYLYRYLVEVLPATRAAAAFIADVFDEESRLGKLGKFPLVGRRIVAT